MNDHSRDELFNAHSNLVIFINANSHFSIREFISFLLLLLLSIFFRLDTARS